MELDLPNDFQSRITGAFGERGRVWLTALPATVARYADQWSLSNVRPHPQPSYAWVGFCESPYGSAVLKLNVPNPEVVTEEAALAAFPASACCRCYAEERENGALLLEALEPGTPLRTTGSFRERMEAATELITRLHGEHPSGSDAGDRGAASGTDFPRYPEQAHRAFAKTRELPELVTRGRRMLAWLEGNRHRSGREALLHADLHHDNILRAGAHWRLIDPKGAMGPLALEAARFIINQYGDTPPARRREEFHEMVAAFAAALAAEPAAVAVCAALDAAVSTCWSMEDHDSRETIAAAGDQALQTYEWASELVRLPDAGLLMGDGPSSDGSSPSDS